ncbi:hypothetical protein KCTC32516_00397 [Polaribacter huanghezhanensis]|nr:hypothetical protein KCTC32516_00397 [Polaribacter huanghezhanensis]
MKKISLYIFTSVLLFSCQQEKKEQIEDSTLTSTSVSKGLNVTTTIKQNQLFGEQLILNIYY